MWYTYAKDKTEYVPTKMNHDLLSRIENFMKTYEIWNRSEAIRTLIEVGLSVSEESIYDSSQVSRGQIIETEVIERTEKITRQRVIVLENIKSLFPKNLTELLTFESGERNAILRKKEWLSREQWRKITKIVKKHDGEWISDGYESHWIIPLT